MSWLSKLYIHQMNQDNHLSAGSLATIGQLKLHEPIILKCNTPNDAYIAIDGFNFKLTSFAHTAFKFKLSPYGDGIKNNCVKLESYDTPGFFVSIDDGGSVCLTSDAALVAGFNVLHGLCGFGHTSFQYVNSNKYLRHQNSIVQIDYCNDQQCLIDTSFLAIAAFPKPKLNIILRGHIRNSFDNQDLRILLTNIASVFDINIYIHSWNIVQNSLSYRYIEDNFSVVNKELIRNYFGEYLSSYIKHIIIENDQNIKLLGNLDGFVGATRCPVRGFKNMLYGQSKIGQYVYNNVNHNEKLVQFRFDVLSSPFPLRINEIMDFLNKNTIKNNSTEKIRFFYNAPVIGIDNIYMGSVSNVCGFMQWFYSHFDEIHEKYRDIGNQEYICFYERENFYA